MTAAWVEELLAKPVIRPRRWAELSGMAPSSVYDSVKNGTLPSIRLGSALYIPTAPLLELLGVTPESDEAGPKADLVSITTPAGEARKESL